MNQKWQKLLPTRNSLRGCSAQAITTDPCALYEGTRGKQILAFSA